jgi:hypothetical protein
MHRFTFARAVASALFLFAFVLCFLTTPAHAQEATPAASGAASQVLLDAAMDALPSGRAIVAVDRWRMRVSPEPMTLPAVNGPFAIAVESGEVRTSDGTDESQLGAGDWQSFTGATAISLQPVGDDEAIVFIVYMIPGFIDAEGVGEYDVTIYTVDYLISTSADDLPGGPGRLVLERLIVPAGSDLPPVESQPFVWTEVGEGALGLTLEGDQLPFRWKSGTERTFRPGQYLPAIADGVQMTFRNAETSDLVLYRLSIVPEVT